MQSVLLPRNYSFLFFHADMQLSTHSNDCWSAHILSGMDGSTQSYISKQKLQNCEPIGLSHSVVDLRERHLSTGHLILKRIRENTTAKTLLLINNGVLFLQKRALVTHLPYFIPKYMFLNLPRNVIRSTARFTLCSHPTIWDSDMHRTKLTSLPVTCVMLMIYIIIGYIQEEQHVLFHCVNHMISLCTNYASLFPPAGAHDVSTSSSQNNSKLKLFLLELIAFMSRLASSRISWLKAFFVWPWK